MALNVKAVTLSPNPAFLVDKLSVKVAFDALTPIENSVWTIEYIVDSANEARSVTQYISEANTYTVGEHVFAIDLDKIDVQDIPEHILLNVSILRISLVENDTIIADLKSVTQLTKNGFGCPLCRTFFNPI